MTHKKKIILIGAVHTGHPATGGDTMKNQLFIERFKEVFDRVVVVDTYQWARRPGCLVRLMVELLFNRGANVVISASPESAHSLLRFLHTIRLKKNVWYWVVGGSFHEKVREGKYNPRYLHFLRAVIVQGPEMVRGLEACGVTQAVYVPNSKPMEYFPRRRQRKEGPLRFVFLSRITPSKGCDYIFESIANLAEKGLASRFTVDFYGKIEDSYAEEFLQKTEAAPNVCYRGYLNMRETSSYDTLAEYDAMLFPTIWQGEGFPGVVLDAYIAGLPVIASDWNLNRTVIRDRETGLIVPAGDAGALCGMMEEAIFGRIDLNSMSERCQREAKHYDCRNVLDEAQFRRLGML